jgi:hypothetical protein
MEHYINRIKELLSMIENANSINKQLDYLEDIGETACEWHNKLQEIAYEG